MPGTQYKTKFNAAAVNYVVEDIKLSGTKVYSHDMQNVVQVNDVLTVKQIPASMHSVFWHISKGLKSQAL